MLARPNLLKSLDLQFFATSTERSARIREIRQEKRELGVKSKVTEDLETLKTISKQLDDLNAELAKLIEEDEEENLDGTEHQQQRNQPIGGFNVLGTYGMGGTQQTNQRGFMSQPSMSKEVIEKRAAQFESGRTIQFSISESELRSITSANVPLQGHASKQLNPGFNEVSSVVDLVKTIPLQGGESYKSGFVVSSGSADYTAESADYYDNEDVKTDYVQIDKAKITTYFELPEEVVKLGGQYYMSFALEAAQTAIRKKLAQQMLVGVGGTNALRGIFNAPTNVIPADSDLEIAETNLPDDILDQIVFGHGGDESVEGGAYLILNKQTLAEFAKKRNTVGDPLYKIKLDINGNVGTISSRDSFEVPFMINSAVKSWKEAVVGDYFLAYGKPLGYELAQFSGIEVMQSTDFKFKSGQICVKASIFAGGNTASYKGFTRVKKA